MITYLPTLPYYPTTFMERGVSVLFTTPALLGTRVRPGDRTTLELIVPNPSGGRGQYVLPWSALQDLCRPTLYDRRLQTAVAQLSAVTPAAIRKATREAAAEGLAGRESKNAARDAGVRDSSALVITNYYLLLSLVHEVMPSARDYGPPTAASAAAVEQAANKAVAQVGPRLGLGSDGVARILEEVAAIFSGVGLGPESTQHARLPVAMTRLSAFHDGLSQWVAECGDDSDNTAELLRSCAALSLTCAATTIADTRKLAEKPVEILAWWREDPEAVAAKVTRPEWILDGWETICAMWERAVTPQARRDAISEIAHFAPILPKEAGEWISKLDVETEATSLFRRLVDLNHDWRSGTNVLQEVVRAEHLLTLNHQPAVAA